MSTVPSIAQSDLPDLIRGSATPVLLDFWAPWCGPCRAMSIVLDRVAQRLDSIVTVRKINIDDSPELAQKLSIRAVPTLVLFKDGNPTSQLVGSQSEQSIDQWVRSEVGPPR